MTERMDKMRAKLERETLRANVATARGDLFLARKRTREKRQEATRHYPLGLVLEGFLFDDAVLLGRVRELVERESPRVRAAFALEETASWFERSERVDSQTVVDTRRFRLGMVLEQLLPGDVALIARVEALVREQPTHVRDAFGLEGEGRRGSTAGNGARTEQSWQFCFSPLAHPLLRPEQARRWIASPEAETLEPAFPRGFLRRELGRAIQLPAARAGWITIPPLGSSGDHRSKVGLASRAA